MFLKGNLFILSLFLTACFVPRPESKYSSRIAVDENRPWVLFGDYFPSGRQRNLTDHEAVVFRNILKGAKQSHANRGAHSPHSQLCCMKLDGTNYYFLRTGETVTFDLSPSHQARFTKAVEELVNAP